ncbi:MAG: chemotaxis protein CheW [Candidatus Thiothrix singaporensis]|uniref:Chemotaxis protein CheW n=1 Tax=Candidatus Thiothrix singaporensis TaxID=2799669 RepID=A0A7L6AV15_9GAMM|nr:MAG: chemotaxis protein CheW [Candidatus Thiothrix singaporensis]
MGSLQQTSAMQATPAPAPTVSRFCYRIGANLILMEPEILAEILTAATVYPVPFTPDWCAGLISLRGELYPVIDMHRVVLGQPMPDNCQLLFFQHPQFPPVVLSCDGYPRHLKLSREDLTEHNNETLPGWIPHILYHDSQTLLAADHGRLLRHIQRNMTRNPDPT